MRIYWNGAEWIFKLLKQQTVFSTAVANQSFITAEYNALSLTADLCEKFEVHREYRWSFHELTCKASIFNGESNLQINE